MCSEKNGPDTRKVILIGAGFVGMSFAYALLTSRVAQELGIIDQDERKARGEAMDLNHGLAFSGGNMKIWAATYEDCADADVVVLAAGVSQKEGETRADLLKRNAGVFDAILTKLNASGFDGVIVVATNPVDVMTAIVRRKTGLVPTRVIGTGTTLDTARLRYLLGSYMGVAPQNIHAYVIGEHGDSELVAWSQAYVSTKSILSVCRSGENDFSFEDLDRIATDVRNAAYEIIAAKRATYYGIGLALLRIVRAIFEDERCILTVSAPLAGEYGEEGVSAGVPAVIGKEGIRKIISLDLVKSEKDAFSKSCRVIRDLTESALSGSGITKNLQK